VDDERNRTLLALEAAALAGAEGVVVIALASDQLVIRERAIALAAGFVSVSTLVSVVERTDQVGLRNAALSVLERQGVRAVEPLIAALATACDRTALWIAEVLGRLGQPAAVASLVALLGHRDPNVAAAAALSLGQLEATVATPALVALLDGGPWQAMAAAHALGQLADPRARPALAARLGDDLLGELAAEAIGRIDAAAGAD
jgi:HEAT repeat protein